MATAGAFAYRRRVAFVGAAKCGFGQFRRAGRESLYELDPKPLEPIQKYLEVIAAQWDEALQNLKQFLES